MCDLSKRFLIYPNSVGSYRSFVLFINSLEMFIFFMGSDPESSCSQYSCLRIYGFLSPDSSHTKPRLFTMFFYKFFRNVYYFFMGSDPTVVNSYHRSTIFFLELTFRSASLFFNWRPQTPVFYKSFTKFSLRFSSFLFQLSST